MLYDELLVLSDASSVMRVLSTRAAMLSSRVSRTSRRSAPKKPARTAACGVRASIDSPTRIGPCGRAMAPEIRERLVADARPRGQRAHVPRHETRGRLAIDVADHGHLDGRVGDEALEPRLRGRAGDRAAPARR